MTCLLLYLIVSATFLLVVPTLSIGASLEPCPNDQFRTGFGNALPDCRAYEQATPVDKNGNNVGPLVNVTQAASQGGAITAFSVGGISGGTGAQDFPLFLATRAPDQWSTHGLYPPASLAPDGGVVGWTPNLASALVFARRFGAGPGLFLRANATGALETIVPFTDGVNKYFFAGASADSQDVTFETGPEDTAQLLPSAAPGKPNLYIWDQATGNLSLAGALNDGQAPPGGAFAGPYDWFSESVIRTEHGGSQQGNYTQETNALSRDGSRVFFTAGGSAQLYMRENPTRPQSPVDGSGDCTEPALACTVRISASQKTNGSGPGGSDPSGPLPAAFMAATPDGASGFFTSSEELTNDATTNAAPASIGRANLDGSGVDQSFLPVSADGVALDGSHIYWADSAQDAIGRANLDGTGVEEEFIAGADDPTAVAVNGTHVYWTNAGTGANGAGTIGRSNLDGSEANQTFITGASNPHGIALDGTYLYWGNAGETAATRKVARAKLDGTEVDQEFIRVTGGLNPGGVAVDGSHIYWSRPSSDAIGRANLDGSEVDQEFISGAEEPRGLALDDTHIYWAAAGNNGVGRANLDGSEANPSFVPVPGGNNPQGVAVDSTRIYFSRPNVGEPGNDLYRYDVSSGQLTDLVADGGVNPTGADVLGVLGVSDDGSHVYFAANGVLAPGASPGDCVNGEAGSGASGICNLYLWHNGLVAFISRLNAGGGTAVTDVTDWQPSSRLGSAFREKTARATPDGGVLLFRSNLQLTSYDNKGVPEFYRYGARDGQLRCISCNPTGAPPTGAPALQTDIELVGPGDQASIQTRNLSDDGARAFFDTPDPLVSGDTNGTTDVYEWEAPGAGSCSRTSSAYSDQSGGCLYLLSTGRAPDPSYFADASASGDDAFFFTSRPLVPQDGDDAVDVYDARVDGGLAAQHPTSLPPCADDACKGNGTSPSPLGSPGSSAFHGEGNQPRRCDSSGDRRRAKGLSRRAKLLRWQARRVKSPQRAVRLHRRAHRLTKRAQALRDRAKRCRQGSSRRQRGKRNDGSGSQRRVGPRANHMRVRR